jgi:putative ABC transport system ATP-binding protein
VLSKLTKSVHINTVAIEITLVMVTHDVGLKNFADRVIWMRDGKIMRLEVIPEDIREQRHEQLDKDLEVR